MARSDRPEKDPKQGPPVSFRPGPELEQLVATLAGQWGVKTNEAFKELAALAAVGLDVRYFKLLAKMTEATRGPNGFVRACLYIHTALRMVAFTPDREGARVQMVVGAAGTYLADRGKRVPAGQLRSLIDVPNEYDEDDAA